MASGNDQNLSRKRNYSAVVNRIKATASGQQRQGNSVRRPDQTDREHVIPIGLTGQTFCLSLQYSFYVHTIRLARFFSQGETTFLFTGNKKTG